MSNNNVLSRNDKAHTPKNRPERVAFGQGSKLAIADRYAKDKDFHYHLFIDRPGELEAAESAWYEYVTDEAGRKVSMPAGKGLTHYLMKIDIETFNKDMATQQKLVDNKTRSVNTIAKEQYSPTGQNTPMTRDNI
jgi:hypothetical protein